MWRDQESFCREKLNWQGRVSRLPSTEDGRREEGHMVTMSLESELCGGQKKASLWDSVRRANTLSWDLSTATRPGFTRSRDKRESLTG